MIDFGQPLAPTFAITADDRREAWASSIAQARDLATIGALEDRLHKRLALLRDREAPNDIEREALTLCAERRAEIAAQAAMRPGATGQAQECRRETAAHERQDHD